MRNIQVTALNPNTAEITWDPVLPLEANGIISLYIVTIREYEGNLIQSFNINASDNLLVSVDGLGKQIINPLNERYKYNFVVLIDI